MSEKNELCQLKAGVVKNGGALALYVEITPTEDRKRIDAVLQLGSRAVWETEERVRGMTEAEIDTFLNDVHNKQVEVQP